MSTIPDIFSRPGCKLCSVGGRIYLVGGRDGRKVTEYNPGTNVWKNMPSLQKRRSAHHSVCAVDNKIFAVSGAGEDTTCEMLDLSDDEPQWKYIANMNSNHKGGGLVEVDGKIYAIGGYRNSSVEAYDAKIGIFCLKNESLIDRFYNTVNRDFKVLCACFFR